MSDQKNTLKALIELGKVDAAISRAVLERKSLEKKLEEKTLLRERAQKDLDRRISDLENRRRESDQIDRRLKDEQLKLVERRKALATFSNYKLQQAAAREIENSSKQLTEQESTVLAELDSIEKSVVDVEKRKGELQKFLQDFEVFEKETRDHIAAIEERVEDKKRDRSVLLQEVDRKLLSEYQRVQHKHAQNPLVPLVDLRCSGCHMHLTQQIVVQLGKGDSLVRCRGCGRILYLEEESSATTQGGGESQGEGTTAPPSA